MNLRNQELSLRLIRAFFFLLLISGFLVGWLVGFLTSSSTTRLYRGRAPRQERLTILRAATHETELGDHGFCFSRSHTDTDPTSRERVATAGIEPGSYRSHALYRRATAPPGFLCPTKVLNIYRRLHCVNCHGFDDCQNFSNLPILL